ncbi:RNA polymerase sigma factor [Acidimangrovimonas sediminis]|uniref:RNA polymerase sigma factor n=1 Tax=Acidimangrovimonas sediminis TaxID=2056283 RepID=UPI000C80FCB9|nr:sigma-70 family RNA polymerase sigma factor [Acidimangrovimonas sediminis]
MPEGRPDETDLVRRLASGERAAFEQVYRQHNASLIRVAAGIVGSRAVAEEMAQDTWVAVLRNISGFEGRSSLAGWIFTILVNRARSRARRDGRMVPLDAGTSDDGLSGAFDGHGHWATPPDLWEEVTPERILAGRDVISHVAAAIDGLPAGQRAVLILRAQEGLDAAEVCAILDLTEGNMRVLLHRARTAVRAALAQLM